MVVLLALIGFLAVACHHARPAQEGAKDTGAFVRDTAQLAVFRDTIDGSGLGRPRGRSFDLTKADQRDSLRAVLKRERALWTARRPNDYRYLLRVSCFCPGQMGWLAMEVRDGRLVQAWNPSGKVVPRTDWNTRTIDDLFDNLEAWVNRKGSVQVIFDPRWHFPTYVYTAAVPGPDMWGIHEARALIAEKGRPAP